MSPIDDLEIFGLALQVQEKLCQVALYRTQLAIALAIIKYACVV